MKRRAFLKVSALAALASSAAGKLVAQQNPAAAGPLPPAAAAVTPPVLQNVSETAATVFWSVSRPATGWVEFGETETLGRIVRGEAGGLLPYDERVLRVRLTGLKPGQNYFYRVQTAPVDFKGPYDIRRSEAAPGPVYTFTTLNTGASTASFIVWNDTHQNTTTLARLVEHLPRHPADFLVWNGDVFNDVRSEEMLITEMLHPAGLEFAATRPLVFTRGNHDVRGPSARLLARAVETPDGRYYYSFRQGPIAFIVLDTGEDKDDSHREYGGLNDFASYRLEQQPWLKQAVQERAFRSAPFRVLLTHIPLRGPAHSKDSCAKWESILATARIDFAISGHTHRHAYHEPTPQQPFPLLVGGGPQPDRATFIHVQASPENLQVKMFGLDGRDLGRWDVKRS